MDGDSFRSGVGRAAPIRLRHIVRHNVRIVAVDGAGCVKEHSPQVLLDVADFGGVIPQAVHDELDVMAVQFQELGLDQLCRVIVPGHPDGLAAVSYTHLFTASCAAAVRRDGYSVEIKEDGCTLVYRLFTNY